MTDALQELLDKRALDELIARQMHAMDSWDWATYRRGLLDDAEFDFRNHGVATDKVASVMKGADLFVATLRSVIEGFDATQHVISNILHVIDGDDSRTSCYIYAEHYLNNDRGDRAVACGGRYEIASARVQDGWKIRSLRWATSWFRGNTSLYALAERTYAARMEGA